MEQRRRLEVNLTDETFEIIEKYEKEYKSKAEFVRQAVIHFEQNRNLRFIIREEMRLMLKDINGDKKRQESESKVTDEHGKSEEITLSDLLPSE